MKINNRTLTKSALSGSILILLLWLLLGTTTTVTWFTDTDDAVNSFVYGNVDIEVKYRSNMDAAWEDVSGSTKLFNSQALYEPGYTQIVWLYIKNKGNVPFDYRLAVNVYQASGQPKNYYGNDFQLPDYLKFGVVFDQDFDKLVRDVNRAWVQNNIVNDTNGVNGMMLSDLNRYYESKDGKGKNGSLEPEEEVYAALVVTMPTTVGNEANYRGTTPPSVKLGIKVLASQKGTIQNIN